MNKLFVILYFLVTSLVMAKNYEITPENRKQKSQEYKEAKVIDDKNKLPFKKKEFEEEYLSLCKCLLSSRGQCILRVNRSIEGLMSDIPMRFQRYLPGVITNVSMEGECYFDTQEKSAIKIFENRSGEGFDFEPLSNWLFGIQLWWLLLGSDLLEEEKERFEQIVKKGASGTIVRDGEKLFIFDSPNKKYHFDQKQ